MKWTSIKKPHNLKSITIVDLGNKNLQSMPKWINKCINLQKLYCFNNQITKIENLPSNLQELQCSNNKITKIENLPSNLQILYCHDNQITKIENLPHNLQAFDCSRNKITKIENLLPNLQELYCSSNNITKIENISPNLQELYCSNNKITKIEFLLHNLCVFNCAHNNITKIENLPSNLQGLNCSNNQITKIENLPHSLQFFSCLYNQITKLENLPLNLRELFCHDNQITELPLHLLELRNLTCFDYSGNPIENIHPLVSRWLKHQKNKSLQVYNDTQSVHNHSIQEYIKKSIYNLLNDRIITPLEKVLEEIINDLLLTDKVKEALIEYSRDLSLHSVIQITFGDLLIPVWSRIQKHQHKDEIKCIMNTEISDGLCKCFTGRISRLVNCLNGFCDDIEIYIGSNEQIGNIVVIVKEQLERTNEYTVERHRELVRTRLREMRYSEEVIKEWLEFID